MATQKHRRNGVKRNHGTVSAALTHIWHTRKVIQASVTLSFTIHSRRCNTPAKLPHTLTSGLRRKEKKHIKSMKNNTKWAHHHLTSRLRHGHRCYQVWTNLLDAIEYRRRIISMCTTDEQADIEKWRIFVCTTFNLCDVMHLSLCWSARKTTKKWEKCCEMWNTHSKMLWRRHRNRLLLLLLSPRWTADGGMVVYIQPADK